MQTSLSCGLHLCCGALCGLPGGALLYEGPHIARAVLRGGRLQAAAAVAGAADDHLQERMALAFNTRQEFSCRSH